MFLPQFLESSLNDSIGKNLTVKLFISLTWKNSSLMEEGKGKVEAAVGDQGKVYQDWEELCSKHF